MCVMRVNVVCVDWGSEVHYVMDAVRLEVMQVNVMWNECGVEVV